MATRVRDAMMQRFGELRFEPTEKRVRVEHGGVPVGQTSGGVLVWEPRRIVPGYAIRVEDVVAPFVPSETSTACPYKGWASYWSFGEHADLAWSYEDPLPDVIVDDVGRDRPHGAATEASKDEFGLR